MMRVLVTGSSGWIASHLIRLAPKEWEIIEFDIKKSKDICNIPVLNMAMKNAELVINLAGEIRVPPSLNNPMPYWRNNAYGAISVFNSARLYGVPVIHASTSAVNNPSSSHYASSKYAAEIAAQTENSLGGNIKIARFFNVYGPDQPKDFVIPKFLEIAKSGGCIEMHNGGISSKDYIYIDDLIQGIFDVSVTKDSYEIYDLGSGMLTTIKDLAYIIKDIMDLPNLQINDIFQSDRINEGAGDMALKYHWPKNWKPKIDIRQGILRMMHNES